MIQGAFKRAFIWPWAPDEFLAAVLKNNGVVDATPSKQPNPVLAAVVEDVRRVVANELQVARREPDVHVMRAKVKKEVRYSTFDLARLAADTEREEAEAAAAKASAKEAKEGKKRKREDEADERRLKKMSTENTKLAMTLCKVCLCCRTKLDRADNDAVGCKTCDCTRRCKKFKECKQALAIHERFCEALDLRSKPELLRVKLTD